MDTDMDMDMEDKDMDMREEGGRWRIFRRYKEWEDLRMRLHQWCGGAPQMPGKVLFGRMRPEVRAPPARPSARRAPAVPHAVRASGRISTAPSAHIP